MLHHMAVGGPWPKIKSQCGYIRAPAFALESAVDAWLLPPAFPSRSRPLQPIDELCLSPYRSGSPGLYHKTWYDVTQRASHVANQPAPGYKYRAVDVLFGSSTSLPSIANIPQHCTTHLNLHLLDY